jgi:hypothetical protein
MLNNGSKLVLTAILTPAIFKASRQLLARPLLNPVNRGLKQLKLSSTIKV